MGLHSRYLDQVHSCSFSQNPVRNHIQLVMLSQFLDQLLICFFFDSANRVWVELFTVGVHGAAVTEHKTDAIQSMS